MRLFGFEIIRAGDQQKALNSVAENRGGWWPVIRESFAGAWQRNITLDNNQVISFHAVYACLTLIASDISKLRVKLIEDDGDGIWTETTNSAYSPVLRDPNPYQNRIQFWETWMLSKLMRGNTYVLKRRDNRGVVDQLFPLDPNRVRPLVADDGSVFYDLSTDPLSGLPGSVIVPAREIIHDRWNCLFHPLIGVSPIFANALAATQGMRIQMNSTKFFANNSTPGGILTAPGRINPDTADTLKRHWEANYGGENVGRIAVLGDGLKFERMAITAVDAQLIEQLKWTAEVVCSTFHVPPYKIGVGPMPTYNNIQALNVEYYSQCLQRLIEDAELCLDEGLNMGATIGIEFDLDGLLRMDSVTQMEVLKEGVNAGVFAPNEARAKIDLKPKPGGESPYLQQQNYSLAALAKRDAKDDPFASGAAPSAQLALPPPPSQLPPPAKALSEEEAAQQAIVGAVLLRRALGIDPPFGSG